jgi:hypothetical protein
MFGVPLVLDHDHMQAIAGKLPVATQLLFQQSHMVVSLKNGGLK